MEDTLQNDIRVIQEKRRFLNDMLDRSINERLDNKTKKRLIKLIAQEIEKFDTGGTEIIKRITFLENRLPNSHNQHIFLENEKELSERLLNVEVNSLEIKSQLYKIKAEISEKISLLEQNIRDSGKEENIKKKKGKLSHKPKETKNFLSLFHNSEGLKYLTHKFKEGKREYSELINLCRKEFDDFREENANIPLSLVRKVEEFAFSNAPAWYYHKGSEKIIPRTGWSEPSFIEWFQKDTSIHPAYDSKWNNEMIVPFKQNIEIRTGSLSQLITDSIHSAFGDSRNNFQFHYDDQELNRAAFYTDVDRLYLGLVKIFSTIKDHSSNLCFDISISCESLDNMDYSKIIKIIHVDSEAVKKSFDPDFIKGDFDSIIQLLWGLCNYEIIARFPDGYKRKVILTDDPQVHKLTKENKTFDVEPESVHGFTHILKFY